MTHILAISGSLRKNSTNKVLLQAAGLLAPNGVTVELYEKIGELPHFNPDLDPEAIPEVLDLKEKLNSCQGLLICSPEYAHGVPGSLKNALDWLVGGPEMVGKPVTLLNASPRSHIAQDSLREILVTMSAVFISEAAIEIPLLGKNLTAEDIAQDEKWSQALRDAIKAFLARLA